MFSLETIIRMNARVAKPPSPAVVATVQYGVGQPATVAIVRNDNGVKPRK